MEMDVSLSVVDDIATQKTFFICSSLAAPIFYMHANAFRFIAFYAWHASRMRLHIGDCAVLSTHFFSRADANSFTAVTHFCWCLRSPFASESLISSLELRSIFETVGQVAVAVSRKLTGSIS